MHHVIYLVNILVRVCERKLMCLHLQPGYRWVVIREHEMIFSSMSQQASHTAVYLAWFQSEIMLSQQTFRHCRYNSAHAHWYLGLIFLLSRQVKESLAARRNPYRNSREKLKRTSFTDYNSPKGTEDNRMDSPESKNSEILREHTPQPPVTSAASSSQSPRQSGGRRTQPPLNTIAGQ